MSQHLGRIPITIAIAIAACAVCLAGDAHVLPNTSPSLTSAQPFAPGSAGLRAYLNPETGNIETATSPAAVQFDADTENALRRDATGLTEEHRADGTVLIDLQGRFGSVSVVHRTADGKLFVCTDDNRRAQKTLQGDIASPAVPEVK